ncbi:peptidase family C78-domain-containing protein [Spinellus fusiger]|nr:peptidase family C78-domain-containing protein [Spinellus fusiger]
MSTHDKDSSIERHLDNHLTTSVWEFNDILSSSERIPEHYLFHHTPSAHVTLCSPWIDYVTSRLWDTGWDCGYRNCQMLMSFLQRHPLTHPFVPRVPSVAGLQQLLEAAWKQGYDPIGYSQLKTVYKTHRWIGTTEVYTMLAFLGIHSTILDFHQPKEHLLDWIQAYYAKEETSSTSSTTTTDHHHRPPLYLQYSGHSVLVIGVHSTQTTRQLLILDAQRHFFRRFRNHKSTGYFSRPFCLGARDIERHAQYQLLVLGRVTATPSVGEGRATMYVVTREEAVAIKTVTSLCIGSTEKCIVSS